MNHGSGFDSDRIQYRRQLLERRLARLIEKARPRLAVGSHWVLRPVEVHPCRKCFVEKLIEVARQLLPNEQLVLREYSRRRCEFTCHPLQQILIGFACKLSGRSRTLQVEKRLFEFCMDRQQRVNLALVYPRTALKQSLLSFELSVKSPLEQRPDYRRAQAGTHQSRSTREQ